ncbi:MAG: hypothetical protein ACFFG0_30610, partial [Candidatus Thorarchaeota archaeon]
DIENEVVKPAPVEMVKCDLIIPYPTAKQVWEAVDEIVCGNPHGVKFTDPTGREIINFETGEIYPRNYYRRK